MILVHHDGRQDGITGRRIALPVHLRGFMKNEIGSRVPYYVRI